MPEPFTCQDLVEVITDYLEGALSPDDRQTFEAHLAECDGCRNYLDEMRQTVTLVGQLSEEALTEESKYQLLELFRDWKTKAAGSET